MDIKQVLAAPYTRENSKIAQNNSAIPAQESAVQNQPSPSSELDTTSHAELSALPATPPETLLNLPLLDSDQAGDYTSVELTDIPHQYLTAPLEAVPGMPMNILVGGNKMVELEAGVSVKTTPAEIQEQQANPIRFQFEGVSAEGYRLELSNGQNYFLQSTGDATFYPNDPELDMLSNTIEFSAGNVTDMRALSEEEREAVLNGN